MTERLPAPLAYLRTSSLSWPTPGIISITCAAQGVRAARQGRAAGVRMAAKHKGSQNLAAGGPSDVLSTFFTDMLIKQRPLFAEFEPGLAAILVQRFEIRIFDSSGPSSNFKKYCSKVIPTTSRPPSRAFPAAHLPASHQHTAAGQLGTLGAPRHHPACCTAQQGCSCARESI